MIRPGEVRKGSGQIQFALNSVHGVDLSAGLKPKAMRPVAPSPVARELVVSANQIVTVLLSTVSLTGLLVWAIVRLWLFEH